MLGLSTDVFSLNPFAAATAAATMAGPVEVEGASSSTSPKGEAEEGGEGSGRSGDLVVGGGGSEDGESGGGDVISISPLDASLVDVLSAVYGTLLLLRDSSRRIRSFSLFLYSKKMYFQWNELGWG